MCCPFDLSRIPVSWVKRGICDTTAILDKPSGNNGCDHAVTMGHCEHGGREV